MRYDEAQQVRYRHGVIAKVVGIKVQSNYNNVARQQAAGCSRYHRCSRL